MTAPTTPGEKYAMVEKHEIIEAFRAGDLIGLAEKILRERDAYREVAIASLVKNRDRFNLTEADAIPRFSIQVDAEALKLLSQDATGAKPRPTEGPNATV